ncbi:MAG: tetratricopeptide repeat protein [Proteobacteria bacterium]|nr:tetratricopeptide repeat protein [Pseudomonadota bacterium]
MSHEAGRSREPGNSAPDGGGQIAHAIRGPDSGAARRHRLGPMTDPDSKAFVLGSMASELVGRDSELSRMSGLLKRAMDTRTPQFVTVVGNQGTGKSRLIAELVKGCVHWPIRAYHGSAIEDGPRYGAITSLLCDRFAISETDDSDTVRKSFEQAVKLVFDDDRVSEVLHFLGSFLNLPFPDSPFLRVLREDRAQHDEIARTVLARFVEADAKKSPTVLILDNLQWADDATLLLLRELGSSLSGSPVAIVVCTRPEMLVRSPDWGVGAVSHARIDLRNLEPHHAERMFRNLLSRCDQVPEDVVNDAVEMTGGNPHFLEQLVRLFIANGTLDTSGQAWRLDPERAADTELPISVEEAIEARIAALEPQERDLLEKGAVFGNVFWSSAMIALTRIENARPTRPHSGRPPPIPPLRADQSLRYTWSADDDPVRKRITNVIHELVERDYLLQLDPEDSTIPGDAELVFKHNLERELIVKSTEPDRLARYHLLAAQWLDTKLAGRSEDQLEFLAQLYERGGDRRRAAFCYLAGGDRARLRYANQEAVELYTRGLAMLDDDDGLSRLTALHNLGDVLDRIGETDAAQKQFREMLRIAWLFDNHAKAGAAHGRLGRIHRGLGDYDRAMEHLREANSLFTYASDKRGISAALDDMGKVHWLRGAYGQALDFYRRALALRRGIGDQRSIALSLANIGRVHHDSGGFKAAIAQFREALELRRSIGDQIGVVQSLSDLGGVHTEDGDHETALTMFSEAYQIAAEIGHKLAQADVLSRLGECKSAMGRGDEAVRDLLKAIDLSTNLGDRAALSECHRRLADVHLAMGAIEPAQEHARNALRISETVGSRVHLGNAYRVLAESTVARGHTPELAAAAEKNFVHAIEILSGMRNELDLARVYRAFAALRERMGVAQEAAALRRRADDIYRRLRGAASVQK